MTYDPVSAAQAALDANHKALALEDGNGPRVALFHLLASLLEWSDAQAPRVDFDSVLGEVREHFAGETLDLSGNDPGYRLITKGGPVILTLETPNGVERKASFATIADAESYLGISRTIDPVDLHEGRYGIDAPHGAGSDVEAVQIARDLGFQLFWSMGAACWAPKGTAISGNISGKGWRTGFLSVEAAALDALTTVEP